jgi:hypothetical protein
MKKSDMVLKYSQYIKESSIESPEENISTALEILKDKLQNLFVSYQAQEDGTVVRYGEMRNLNDKNKGISFSELGLELNDVEKSKNSIKLQFSDDQYLYDILFYIDLEAGVSKDKSKNFNVEEMEGWQIKMKKFTNDTFEQIGETIVKNEFGGKKIKFKDIVGEKDEKNKLEELLVKVKKDFDDLSGDEEKFEIETD